MQKKTTALHVGSWMVFFLTKCLRNAFRCNFKITKFRPLILVRKIHILGKKRFPVFSTQTPCFPLRPRVFHQTPRFPPDPAFSTRPRVFHQTPRFPPHPAFSTPRVFHTPWPLTPYPGTLAPRFPPSPIQTPNTLLKKCRHTLLSKISITQLVD